jgi:hypothetical protein
MDSHKNQDDASVAELERSLQHDGGILSMWLDKVAASDSLPIVRRRFLNCGPSALDVRTRKSKTAC